MAHAYFLIAETEEGVSHAATFLAQEKGLVTTGNPNVTILRHGLFSVEDARRVRALAELAPAQGTEKAIVIAVQRFFHEAQNALLKIFEEPPAGTTLILILPAEGILLPTLRSRLLPLPSDARRSTSQFVATFLNSAKGEREKILERIVTRSKSDKDDEKQAARMEAVRIVEGLTMQAYEKLQNEKNDTRRAELRAFLDDTNIFLPILHERSAPLKLIFEHVLLTSPV